MPEINGTISTELAATQAALGVFPARTVIMAGTRGQVCRQSPSSGITSATYRTRHKSPLAQSVGDVRLVFTNFAAEGDGANDIVVRAGLEYPSATPLPVYFNGRRSVTIEPGGYAVSDPVSIEIPAATFFFVRSFASVASGSWPLGITTYPTDGEGNDAGSDKTTAGTVSTAYTFAFSPLAILGTAKTPTPGVLIVGDSIASGQGDSNDYGFIVRAINGRYGYTSISKPGETAATFAVPANHRKRMLAASMGATIAVCQYGVNDVVTGRTLAQIQADLTAIWTALAQRGLAVYQTTITPGNVNGNTTDSWATLVGQTAHAADSVRQAVNAWIRTAPAPLTGVFDVAATVESGMTGKWIVNGSAGYATADGTHPSAAAHALMAAAVTL